MSCNVRFSSLDESELSQVITPISSDNASFFDNIDSRHAKYLPAINYFADLVNQSRTSAELLHLIRNPQLPANLRMSLLKLFRRLICEHCDTEATKKIKTPTEFFVAAYGNHFQPIEYVKSRLIPLTPCMQSILSVLLGEYDNRGKSGYGLTERFFDWFQLKFGHEFTIDGPTGAGRDIQLNTILPDFHEEYPCDFIIRKGQKICAVGFARYDSTRGGAQSDDRTGGNSDKVTKAIEYSDRTGKKFKLIFLSDGPGLLHNDTLLESRKLDVLWNDNVRVTTLKLSEYIITKDWLLS
ncbi:hypothetical protein ACK34X_11745 [Aeromonas veronii]